MSLVISCDLRPSFSTIRNQGSRPTCVAFAVTDAHAFARKNSQVLSAEHLYYHAIQRTPGGHPDDGVSLPKILEALRLDGQASESGWPYMNPLPADLTLWAPPPTATPIFKRDSISAGAVINAIIACLSGGTPVVLTFMVSEAFCKITNGVVLPRTSDPDVGWHAVIAVGHGVDGSNRLLLVRNSWGDAWGLGGYAWVDCGYLVPRLYGLATMTPGSTS